MREIVAITFTLIIIFLLIKNTMSNTIGLIDEKIHEEGDPSSLGIPANVNTDFCYF